MNRNATATILIVLAIGIYFTFTRGIINDAKAVLAVNSQYTSAIGNAEQLIKVREQVLTTYNAISQEDRARLEKMIPDTVDNIRLIIDLNSVAARHGLLLKGVTATAPSANAKAPAQPTTVNRTPTAPIQQVPGSIPTPTLDTVTVSFTVTAPYLTFITFLQDLEANLRIMDVSHLSLGADDTGQYEFSVRLKTYWLRQ